MSTLAQIRTAAASTITAAIPTGFNAYPKMPANVVCPCAAVMPDTTTPQSFARGTVTFELDLIVLVDRGNDEVAQANLDPYVTPQGASSIWQIIWNAPTLGLADTHAHISGISGYGATYTVGDKEYVGAKLRLVAHTSGTA